MEIAENSHLLYHCRLDLKGGIPLHVFAGPLLHGIGKMKKISILFLAVIWTILAGGRLAAADENSIPKDQQAKIEGLTYTAMLSPLVKEKWPDLRTFSITKVTGENIGAFSKTEAIIGPGQCIVTVDVRTRQRGSATLTLTFVAEAGSTYELRPVYRGKAVQASIMNTDTGEMVARTWNLTKKSKSTAEPNALADAP
jgi:hypothetical protein